MENYTFWGQVGNRKLSKFKQKQQQEALASVAQLVGASSRGLKVL